VAGQVSESGPHRRRFTRIASYGIIVRGDWILLARLSPRISSMRRWTLPGGGVEFGEHPIDALIREVREETGLAIVPRSLLEVESRILDFPDLDMHAIRFYFSAEVSGGDLTNEADGTTDTVEWVPLASARDRPLADVVHYALEILADSQMH